MKSKKIITAMLLLVTLVLMCIILLMLRAGNNPDTAEEALKQAREFKSDKVCSSVVTPAVHEATGAAYTFGSSCMPEGWKPLPSNP